GRRPRRPEPLFGRRRPVPVPPVHLGHHGPEGRVPGRQPVRRRGQHRVRGMAGEALRGAGRVLLAGLELPPGAAVAPATALPLHGGRHRPPAGAAPPPLTPPWAVAPGEPPRRTATRERTRPAAARRDTAPPAAARKTRRGRSTGFSWLRCCLEQPRRPACQPGSTRRPPPSASPRSP